MGGYRRKRLRKYRRYRTDPWEARDMPSEVLFQKDHHRWEGQKAVEKEDEDFVTCDPAVPEDVIMRNNTQVRHTQVRLSPMEDEECSNRKYPTSPEDNTDWLSLMYEYELQSLLVTGSFGGFYTARRIIDGLPVAIKVMNKDSVSEWICLPGEMRPVPLEIVLMNHIAKAPTSPGVIQLLNWCVSSYNVFLIFDLPEHCVDLDKFVFNNPRYLDESLVRCIFQQIVEAIQHCQERGVYHRDLKMSNVLIQSHSCQIKLINFGCGSHLREGEYTSYRGTLKYAPPEWFVKRRFQAVPATVWSLGVVLYALIFGILPFGTKEETIKGKLRFPCVISPECLDLLLQCLSHRPKDRPTLRNILNHSWMN